MFVSCEKITCFSLFLHTDQLLEEFARHEEGPDPTARLKNNVQSKVFRIKNFLAFMSHGQTNLATFVFLDNTQRIRE